MFSSFPSTTSIFIQYLSTKLLSPDLGVCTSKSNHTLSITHASHPRRRGLVRVVFGAAAGEILVVFHHPFASI